MEPDPRSGKTVFLTWLLMRRLALKLPTVLQVNEHRAILFHEGGTSQFLDLEDTEAYAGLRFDEPSSRIWVLIYSNQVSEPAPIFHAGRSFFIIQAASRYRDFHWARKVCFEYFCMKTWPLSEVLRASVIPPPEVHNTHAFCSSPFFHSCPPSESQIRYLYNTYSASPRELVHFARRPNEYKILVARQVQQIKPGTLLFALQSPDFEGTCDLITRVEPSPTSRFVHERTIASRGVFELLWERYLKNRIAEMKCCYNDFKSSSVTAPAAGWIFELRMHQLLRQGYPLKLFPLGLGTAESKKFDIYDDYKASHKRGNAKNHQLAVSQEHHLAKWAQLQVNHYYRPSAILIPTIDSLLLVHPFGKLSPILLTFQMTRDEEERRMSEDGLRGIEDLEFPSDTRRYHVVVTPRGMEPRMRIPRGCFKRANVFHHPVDEDALF